MGTDYQTVAVGTVAPLSNSFVESGSDAKHKEFQESLSKWIKNRGITRGVGATTEFTDYQNLVESAWQNDIVERVYQTVIALTISYGRFRIYLIPYLKYVLQKV